MLRWVLIDSVRSSYVYNQVPFNFFCLTPDENINSIAIHLKKKLKDLQTLGIKSKVEAVIDNLSVIDLKWPTVSPI